MKKTTKRKKRTDIACQPTENIEKRRRKEIILGTMICNLRAEKIRYEVAQGQVEIDHAMAQRKILAEAKQYAESMGVDPDEITLHSN